MPDSSKQKTLITRPLEDAQATQELLKQHNIDADYQPFLSISYHDIKIDLSRYEVLIFTSQNAVRAYCISNTGRSINVYCVGDKTAELCREHGFKNVYSASGTVKDLENLLSQQSFSKPILYLRGKDISSPLQHPELDEEVIYETNPTTEIEVQIHQEIEQQSYGYILFFSTRTAQSFANYIIEKNLKDRVKETKALCLADSMIKSLSVLPWQEIIVADRPTQDSLLKLLQK